MLTFKFLADQGYKKITHTFRCNSYHYFIIYRSKMRLNTLALCFVEGWQPALCRMLRRQLDNFLRLIKHFALKGASPPLERFIYQSTSTLAFVKRELVLNFHHQSERKKARRVRYIMWACQSIELQNKVIFLLWFLFGSEHPLCLWTMLGLINKEPQTARNRLKFWVCFLKHTRS